MTTRTGELAAFWVESKAAKAFASLPWPRQNPAGLEMAPRMQGVQSRGKHSLCEAHGA